MKILAYANVRLTVSVPVIVDAHLYEIVDSAVIEKQAEDILSTTDLDYYDVVFIGYDLSKLPSEVK